MDEHREFTARISALLFDAFENGLTQDQIYHSLTSASGRVFFPDQPENEYKPASVSADQQKAEADLRERYGFK